MGLRTASARRPFAEVMAPALTDPAQKQSFASLSLTDATSSPHTKFLHECFNSGDSANRASDCCTDDIIMSESPTLNMGLLHKAASTGSLDATAANGKMKNEQICDQILNLNSPPGDVDLPQNLDEIMQAIKSTPDDEIVEKFLTDVDMMNISIEDQTDMKETQAKESLIDLKQVQRKIERRLDFLCRKIRKLQTRTMGQHVSGEVAGVFEYVHRSLKRLKDSSSGFHQQLDDDTRSTPKAMSYNSAKNMLKKLEMAASLQASSVARQKHSPKYFGAGSSSTADSLATHRVSGVAGVVNLPPWPMEHKLELQKVAGMLATEVALVQEEVDSEATESSSGGESCDEMQNYNNPHQQYLSIQKRALWKYASQRAAIASRWTWLQAQISDLEYRIRQHSDIHRHFRVSKGELLLGGPNPPEPPTNPAPPINGYRGQLPGAAKEMDDNGVTTPTPNGAHTDYQCARTRPLLASFPKRKLVQLNGLHVVSRKANRPSSVRCGCRGAVAGVASGMTTAPCAVCTGRTDATHPRDAVEVLSKAEKVSLVDGGFHPVFSLPEDVSYAIHCEAIMKSPEWQQRSTRMKSLKLIKTDRSDKSVSEHRSKKLDHRKKYNNRLLKPSTMSALSAKIRNKIRGRKSSSRHSTTSTSLSASSFRKRSRFSTLSSHLHGYGLDAADEEVESIGNNSNSAMALTTASNSAVGSPSSSPLLHMQAISGFNRRNRTDSYDIDNIVIPYSVAAATRVEKLQYKEILTPKWRIAELEFKCDKNNGAVRNPSQDSDAEDLSEECVTSRHDKSEYEEKKKFLSYLKLPYSSHHGRSSRSHKRTDSLAESSGANTPDPLSPHPPDLSLVSNQQLESPLTSPPATPLPHHLSDEFPSIAVLRRRTMSQSQMSQAQEPLTDDVITPYDARTFPIDDDTYDKMLKNMPENHQVHQTNYRAQDSADFFGYMDVKPDSPGTESTESAIGDEDPNDPEWMDEERRDNKHHRR